MQQVDDWHAVQVTEISSLWQDAIHVNLNTDYAIVQRIRHEVRLAQGQVVNR